MLGNKSTSSRLDEGKIDSIVSSNITIEGKFTSTGSVRVDCKIVGEVNSDSLFVGKDSTIKGDINCNNLIISGKIEGNVTCKNKLYIKDTGVIDGDLTVNLMTMDEGAQFNGKCTKIAKNDSSEVKADSKATQKK